MAAVITSYPVSSPRTPTPKRLSRKSRPTSLTIPPSISNYSPSANSSFDLLGSFTPIDTCMTTPALPFHQRPSTASRSKSSRACHSTLSRVLRNVRRAILPHGKLTATAERVYHIVLFFVFATSIVSLVGALAGAGYYDNLTAVTVTSTRNQSAPVAAWDPLSLDASGSIAPSLSIFTNPERALPLSRIVPRAALPTSNSALPYHSEDEDLGTLFGSSPSARAKAKAQRGASNINPGVPTVEITGARSSLAEEKMQRIAVARRRS